MIPKTWPVTGFAAMGAARGQIEYAEMRKISRMAGSKERKHIKKANYCFDNKSTVNTSFSSTTMGID
jgi:hypothetical protein